MALDNGWHLVGAEPSPKEWGPIDCDIYMVALKSTLFVKPLASRIYNLG